jgi:hypothetical protein
MCRLGRLLNPLYFPPFKYHQAICDSEDTLPPQESYQLTALEFFMADRKYSFLDISKAYGNVKVR